MHTQEHPKVKKLIFAVTIAAFLGVVLAVSLGSTSGDSASIDLLKQAPGSNDLTILGLDDVKSASIQAPAPSGNQGWRSRLVNIESQGRLLGTTLSSRKGREYFAFYKVPYARPPVGKLRFQPPEPPSRWNGIRDATKPGPQCIQKEKYAPELIATGKEDCLFLNIYTPKLPEDGADNPKLPVLFYLHGGAMNGNGTRYGAKYFMDEEAILITVEHPIGILGYFTTGTLEYPGNYGSKDQVLALKWVQKNIAKFGGDPTRVMIFGNSGGAISSHTLLVSPMAKGLFSSAIMQSGNWVKSIPFSPEAAVKTLSEEVGCDSSDQLELVNCLRSVDAEKIVLTKTQEMTIGYIKEPVPENGDESNTYLPDLPWNLIQKGRSAPVPTIFGSVSQESMSTASVFEPLLDENSVYDLNQNWNEELPTIVGIPDDENHTVATKFHKVYFGDRLINNDTRVEWLNLHSDSYYHPQKVAALLHTQTTGQPAYLYWVTKEPAKSYAEKYKQTFPPPYGLSHADELQFFFLYESYPEIPVGSPWFKYSEALVKMWVSFAATGKPESTTEEWKPIDPADNGMKWFELGDQFREIEPATKRMQLWDEYMDELYLPKM